MTPRVEAQAPAEYGILIATIAIIVIAVRSVGATTSHCKPMSAPAALRARGGVLSNGTWYRACALGAAMATRIRQLAPAEGWFAVFAHSSVGAREHHGPSGQRTGALARGGGPVSEFLPLVAWALVVDDEAGGEPDRVIGMVVLEGRHPELILDDDPSFLGYAGPGDPGIDRVGFATDWRAQAKQAIGELKRGNGGQAERTIT